MQLIRGLANFPAQLRGAVATIGNFDGVHLGHQQLIRETITRAKTLAKPALIIVFEPQSGEYFAPKKAPARLMRLREKYEILKRYGFDALLCLRFNQQLACLSAQRFIDSILVEWLNISHLVIGDDFRFGSQRDGDCKLLETQGQLLGFSVSQLDAQLSYDQRVSSTLVRSLLQQGQLQQVKNLLGRDYSLWGKVVHGAKRGRQWGFPTANVYLHREAAPVNGVFAVQVQGINDQILQGVANVGIRPTVDGLCCLLEVFIFDFDQMIYGHYIQVDFMRKLRDEQRFADFDQLKAQIQNDVIAARAFFDEREHDRL